MSWLYLTIAGLMEIGWAISLKRSEGFRLLGPSILAVTLMIGSIWLLALALRQLPVGTAYAVWTGIGAIGTAAIGMLFLNEPRDAARVICIVLIGAGIIGLKLVGGNSE
jgi:quaternary ammonium compound-resistance protein SugE